MDSKKRLAARIEEARKQGHSDATAYCNVNSDVEADGLTDYFLEETRELAGVNLERCPDDLRDQLIIAYDDGVQQAVAEAKADRQSQLDEAGAAGYRVCVFGLPGSRAHRSDWAKTVAAASELSDRLFQPGPCGPYDSEILTPAEADAQRWQSGQPIYRDDVESILADFERTKDLVSYTLPVAK